MVQSHHRRHRAAGQLRRHSDGVTYTTNFPVDLPGIVGADTAYVGMAGATGSFADRQTVSNFMFVTFPVLAAEAGPANSVVLSWPASIGGYHLQTSPALTAGSWTDLVAPVTVAGDRNQVTIASPVGTRFYRLVLQVP